ncbi:MAG TPA: C25 family cysteine peptidase [Candidatus Syntrophosphaera thermopropionivorans]|nr:C25 family cysteine peptidase [Candidatus Syntrophosphaera thermopropionivorans]
MNRRFLFLTILFIPFLLTATELTLNINFSDLELFSPQENYGWGTLSVPGTPQLPTKNLNIILPPDAINVSYNYEFAPLQNLSAPAPVINTPFSDGENFLSTCEHYPSTPMLKYLGIKHWGDIKFVSFSVLPAIYNGVSWHICPSLQINLSWSLNAISKPNRIPPILSSLQKNNQVIDWFFVNPQDLQSYYTYNYSKDYDYLIVTTPALYPSLTALEAYHQSQGLVTSYININTILASSPGLTDGEKLRNYLISQYNAHPFTYLLLVGDYDKVPVMYLTPEPDGNETVPSDFFYSDLSSIIDVDSDGRLGEYSAGEGDQDYLCDFTPELFVGRISNNNVNYISQIVNRTISFDSSDAVWKKKALLPAAYLNYAGEPETIFLETDGAVFMEYARNTALNDYQCTTMYEHMGYLPSLPSDLDLDYDLLKNQLNSNSYGILNWSAHGSSVSSARKVWMNDDNGNNIPDSWEMNWYSLVDRETFDNLVNQDGLILFAASCNNGMLDNNFSCLAEYALQQKAVNVCAATRTGWYKIGWKNPGWGGLSSYNYHFLENLTKNNMSVGAALAFANLLHTQYYLFGDPVDSDGIIYPELQNVYTYMLFGDPAVYHQNNQNPPLGEILVYEPLSQEGLPVVNALNNLGNFNVIYSDKLIPDYNYINNFEAIFCLFGWGPNNFIPEQGSLEYNLLNDYLENGGRIYLEGDMPWDSDSIFWSKFGTICPLNTLAYIEAIRYDKDDLSMTWQYNQNDPWTTPLLPYPETASELFYTSNSSHPNFPIGIYNSNGYFRTVASSFALSAIEEGEFGINDMIAIILDTLNVLNLPPTPISDSVLTPSISKVITMPNPFSSQMSFCFETKEPSKTQIQIFNLRGQKIKTIQSEALGAGKQNIIWDGCDAGGKPVPAGIYLWKMDNSQSIQQGKLLKLH